MSWDGLSLTGSHRATARHEGNSTAGPSRMVDRPKWRPHVRSPRWLVIGLPMEVDPLLRGSDKMLEESCDVGRANSQRFLRFGHPPSGCPRSLFRSGGTSAFRRARGFSSGRARCLLELVGERVVSQAEVARILFKLCCLTVRYRSRSGAVSYTHLTLPTILLV